MNSEDEDIMKQLHSKFMDTIDARYLTDFFYSRKVLSQEDCKEISVKNMANERTRELLFLLPRILPSMDIFCEALSECGYDFLVHDVNQQKLDQSRVYRQRKCELFGTHRRKLVEYRHQLKKLTHSGKHSEFKSKFKEKESQWLQAKRSNFENMSEMQSKELADFYFYTLDAKCEYKRLIFDKTFITSDIFTKIRELTKYTSECNVPFMLCSARYGSAVFMANNQDLEGAHKYIREAKEKFDLVKACRETGIVLYIEYNMFLVSYSKSMDYSKKEHLLTLGYNAISHFNEETVSNPEVARDFIRMCRLKLAHLYLGIGLFGDYCHEVEQGEIEKAKKLIGCIEERETWERMESRWKWFYHLAKARLHYFDQCFDESLNNANHALEFAMEGGYPNEIESTKAVIQHTESSKRNT